MIIRVEKNKSNPYVIKSKVCDNDKSLSFKAKGIHSFLMGLPDDWEINISHLSTVSSDGKTAVREGINELIAAGYIKRSRERLDGGKFGRTQYTVYEHPQMFLRKSPKQANLPKSGFPHTDKPHMGNPDADNRTLLYNESTKKGKEVKNDFNNASSSFFSKKSKKTQSLGDAIGEIIPEITKIGKKHGATEK